MHTPKKKAVYARYKRFRAKRTSHKQVVLCWRFIHFIHVNGDARWTQSWFPFSMHTTMKPCKNTAAAYGWTTKFGEPSSFDLGNGSTSWISVFRALFITSYWLVCHAMKIDSNAADPPHLLRTSEWRCRHSRCQAAKLTPKLIVEWKSGMSNTPAL